jgi:hypothetical protein
MEMTGDPEHEVFQRLGGRLEGIERELARQNRLLLAIGLALTDDTIDSDLILRAEQRRLPDEGRGSG